MKWVFWFVVACMVFYLILVGMLTSAPEVCKVW